MKNYTHNYVIKYTDRTYPLLLRLSSHIACLYAMQN